MFNKVIIVGNLTRNVELKRLGTGMSLANIALASNRKFRKQDGTYTEDTCFVDVTLFGRTAEVANQYLKKGSKILIEGRLNYETWSDQHGNKRSKHTIIAESMEMLDTRQNDNRQSDENYANYSGYDSNSFNNYGGSSQSYGDKRYSSAQAKNKQNMESQSIESMDDEEMPPF